MRDRHSISTASALLACSVALPTSVAVSASLEGIVAAPTLGIFADAAGTQTCATLAPGASMTLYLVASPGGLSGVTGAEFRVSVTNPAGYLFFYTPPPGTVVVIGDPIDLTPNDGTVPAGVNVVPGGCLSAPHSSFGTVQVLNTGTGGPTEFRIQRRDPPLNPNFTCPLFTTCEAPSYPIVCMQDCSVDETGSAVASRMSLNDAACVPQTCAAACATPPCVSLTAQVAPGVCAGSPVLVTAVATNCSGQSEDVQVFIEGQPAGSFAAVAAGQSVTASRTFVRNSCQNNALQASALAIAAGCPAPRGTEISRDPGCAATCANQPPTCAAAFASPATLWPADGSLVEVEVLGVHDPEGGGVVFENPITGSDEPVGAGSVVDACPDAIVVDANHFRLRAQRSNSGDGRVYVLSFRASDAAGAECVAEVEVCVPRKPGVPCQRQALLYSPSSCDRAPTGNGGGGGTVLLAHPAGNRVEATFTTGREGEYRVDVYDIRGRRLATIARNRFAAGRHLLTWDGRGPDGHTVANGVYVLRVQGEDDTSLTAKVALVR